MLFRSYSEYRISLESPKEKAPAKTKEQPAPQAAVNPVKKLSFKEQKELEDSEAKIAELEGKIQELSNSLLTIDSADYTKIQEISKTIEGLNQELETVTERWLTLSEQ